MCFCNFTELLEDIPLLYKNAQLTKIVGILLAAYVHCCRDEEKLEKFITKYLDFSLEILLGWIKNCDSKDDTSDDSDSDLSDSHYE
jgi:hypothetical protein